MTDFSKKLRAKGGHIWQRTLAHPFVRGIGDGSLPLEKFRYYMAQDYLFLIEYSRVLALASARAHSLEEMAWFARLLDSTLNVEMGLHRGFAGMFGITERELEATGPSPSTHAYTRHLLHACYTGSMGEAAAALLPCQWGYCEIGQALARKGEPSQQPLYGQWIRMYASEEFAALARQLRQMVDRLGDEASPSEQERMAQAFLTSSRYEYQFWEAAWNLENWPV
ncbi:MAG: thiaminase II [Chloroflexi bacterium]|nr:thiaminase II [Chloroflexota bacterium]